jgi:hypothetical protein
LMCGRSVFVPDLLEGALCGVREGVEARGRCVGL